MRRLFALALLMALPAWGHPAHPEDAAFLAAREAFQRGDRAKLNRALSGLASHPLTPWGEYFRLSQQLEDGSDAGVAEFLARHEGSYLAEKLRGDWIRYWMRKEDWAAARAEFARLKKPDGEMHCRGLDIRTRLNEAGALDEARGWLAQGAPLGPACLSLMNRLAAAGQLPDEAVAHYLRRQIAQGKTKEARAASLWQADGPAWREIEAVLEHPARHLAKLAERFAATRAGRELALYAVLRLSRTDSRIAAARWQEIEQHYPMAERGFVWARLALAAAQGHLDTAPAWFERALKLGHALDEEEAAWRVRAALRAEDWPLVARAIDALPPAQSALPEWRYWRARAHLALGERERAQEVFARIAGAPHFYGILASEALGRPYLLPAKAAPPTAEELAAAAATPGLQRGLALIRLGLRIEGVREWNWTLEGMNDRALLAAAEFARRAEVIDRAIHTAERTQSEHDFNLRYPMPFFERVAPRVLAAGLDTAWVYGLMRQESRFVMDAKSSAGAQGLMQLMPATAKWVARKIGLSDYHPGKVTEMDTNLILGTSYMRMVMDSLDNHPLLASAAYNAGPGRARKWRAERPLEGAIYAETIPFNETRDYVKKVMANAIHYAALQSGRAPSLTSRLGTIRPRGFDDRQAEDLP
ncbi:MAG: lytic transglycosylase domain-containing protein [Rhodocyclaceae bacterium]|nr:lytic transglycosylase domain-containing protein [Rhodocyclaceae bacterium]